MYLFLKNCTYPKIPIWGQVAKSCPIGVDMGGESLQIAQLRNKDKVISLIAGGSEKRPRDVEPGSAEWQRWAIEAIRKITANGKFQGRNVASVMPADEVFIDHIKMPKTTDGNDGKMQDALVSKIKPKLPFEADDAMIKYIPTEDNNTMVIATEREKIDRYLAIYENAQLVIKSIAVWPAALVNSYTKFFGRRKTDIEAIVILLDIEANRTNVVICRHKNLLFARSIPIGAKQLRGNKTIKRLMLELNGFRQQFNSMYRKNQIERLIFLSGQVVNREACTTIAKQLELPAQVGDCLAAVEISAEQYGCGIDRRGCQVNWATAFGLSLS